MVTADTSVRLAWAADADAIAAVQLRAWSRRYADDATLAGQVAALAPADVAAAWTTSLTRPPEARRRALVALERVRVVGFALTGPSDDPDGDAAADGEVAELTVDPDATRRGHGSRLLQACVDTLAADGFDRAVTWVATTDDVLRGFLADAGWVPDGAARELADPTGGVSVRQVRLHVAVR